MSTPSPVTFALVTFVPVCAVMPCLRNDFSQLGRHGLVFDRHEARQQLEDRDLAAEAAEDRRELHADGAAAHDGDRLRDLLQVDGLVARDDALAIDRRCPARCGAPSRWRR